MNFTLIIVIKFLDRIETNAVAPPIVSTPPSQPISPLRLIMNFVVLPMLLYILYRHVQVFRMLVKERLQQLKQATNFKRYLHHHKYKPLKTNQYIQYPFLRQLHPETQVQLVGHLDATFVNTAVPVKLSSDADTVDMTVAKHVSINHFKVCVESAKSRCC